VALTRTEVVLRCGFVLRGGCCDDAEAITEAQLEAGYLDEFVGDELCVEGDQPHRWVPAIECGHPDAPPMAPGWTHERWTGHEFEPYELG